MLISILDFIVYIIQQFGQAFGVGAATVGLFMAIHPPKDSTGAVVGKVERIGFWMIVVSGVLITVAHVLANDIASIISPAYVGKWLLILILFGTYIAMIATHTKDELRTPLAKLLTATWYALFLLHITAPAGASFLALITMYLTLIVIFFLIFKIIIRSQTQDSSTQPTNTQQ